MPTVLLIPGDLRDLGDLRDPVPALPAQSSSFLNTARGQQLKLFSSAVSIKSEPVQVPVPGFKVCG